MALISDGKPAITHDFRVGTAMSGGTRKGGEHPTVTDADVVLGYLDPQYFLGGRMRIFPEQSREAIAR